MFSPPQGFSKVGARVIEGVIITAVIAFCSGHFVLTDGTKQLEASIPDTFWLSSK
jgi:hypothetical protein